MSGDIYFGFDRTKPVGQWVNDGYVDTPTFLAFGDLLDAALEQSCSGKLAEIKESEVQMIYNFCRLDALDYNTVIRAIRMHVEGLVNPTDWQQKGAWVWREMAEPFIRKDERYDFEFHGELRPLQI